jgi:hypothetical protein
MLLRAHSLMTTLTVACIDFRSMRHVACQAFRCDTLVVLTCMERLITPVRMTGFTGLRGFDGCLLRVRIVTRSTLSSVWIQRRVKVREDFPHIMTAQALLRAGHESTTCRVARRERRDIGCELVAAGAVEISLVPHLAQYDADLVCIVAAALSARGACGLESMQLFAMTRDALQVLQCARVGLEMNTVARRCCDPLPGRGVLRHVTFLTDLVRNVRVLQDSVGTLGDPHIKLRDTRRYGLLMTRMT